MLKGTLLVILSSSMLFGCSSDLSEDAPTPQLQTGSVSTTIEVPTSGCLTHGLTLETEHGVRAMIEPGSCLLTRSGEVIDGSWEFGIDEGGEVTVSDPGVLLMGAARLYARRGTETVGIVASSSIAMEIELGDRSATGYWYRYRFANDPLGEIGAETGPLTGYIVSAISLRDGPERFVVDGSQTVGFGFFEQQGRGLRTAHQDEMHEVSGVIPPQYDSEPHLCGWSLINGRTAEIVHGSNTTIQPDHLDRQTSVNGRFEAQMSAGHPRRVTFRSEYENVFVLNYLMCNSDTSTSGAQWDFIRPLQGGSPAEAVTDGEYVGLIHLLVTGSKELVALEGLIEGQLDDPAKMAIRSYKRSGGISKMRATVRDARSTRLLGRALPDHWSYLARDRELKIVVKDAPTCPAADGNGASIGSPAAVGACSDAGPCICWIQEGTERCCWSEGCRTCPL